MGRESLLRLKLIQKDASHSFIIYTSAKLLIAKEQMFVLWHTGCLQNHAMHAPFRLQSLKLRKNYLTAEPLYVTRLAQPIARPRLSS